MRGKKYLPVYQEALRKSPQFVDHMEKFIAFCARTKCAGCVVFSIGDAAYSYSYDESEGFSLYKHNPNRSAYLINTGRTFVIE